MSPSPDEGPTKKRNEKERRDFYTLMLTYILLTVQRKRGTVKSLHAGITLDNPAEFRERRTEAKV